MYRAPAPFFHTWRDNLSNVSCARPFFSYLEGMFRTFFREVYSLSHFFPRLVPTLAQYAP